MSKRKPYTREMKADWWRKDSFFTMYIIREGSSLVIALYCFMLIAGLFSLTQGQSSFETWLGFISHPITIVFQVLTLVWTLYHSYTWFQLAPKAANLWMGEKRVPDSWIVNAMYAALAGCSALGLIILFL
ncbi:fumarate reductase subunit C [Alginatibacterium sediminis]|uniref:Fumarate reductase subunit C n=1 Tax=Alginatibacterium sediminis TaxID=2164068 RepID=A0A420E7Q2_9ALTE|nr:fumarate reductase subunit C [Alginatibacterium sediminis]RKF14511.1 fumarate reductase subunit C [Alginatibacterium sediminis]